MRYGLSAANFGTYAEPARVAELAATAEERRLGRALPLGPPRVRVGPPAGDPWLLLAAAAHATERLRLGTHVTPVARRRPHVARGDRRDARSPLGRTSRLRRRARRKRARVRRVRRGDRRTRSCGAARRGARPAAPLVARRAGHARRSALRRRRRRARAAAAATTAADLDRRQRAAAAAPRRALRRVGREQLVPSTG